MNHLEIHTTNSDAQIITIEKLGKEIWLQHYSAIIGINQVNYMLEKFQSIKAITNQQKEGYIYYNLSLGKEDIGYFSVQPRSEKLFLSKVYIVQKHRGNGYFSEILKFIENLAIQLYLKTIELTVNKYNKQTISIYQSKGFEITGSEVFDIGNNYVMDDFILSKIISKINTT